MASSRHPQDNPQPRPPTAGDELRPSDRRDEPDADLYRAIIEEQPAMVCRFRPGGEILYVNPAYARALGTTPEALAGADFWVFVDAEDRTEVRGLLAGISPDAPTVSIENRFETADGPRWTLWTNHGTHFDDDGRAVEIHSAGIDITERKRIEQALLDSRTTLAAVLDHLPVGVGMTDLDGRPLSVNAAGLCIHGIDSIDAFPKSISEYVRAFDVRTLDGRPLSTDPSPLAGPAGGDPVDGFEVRLRRPDGEKRAVSFSVSRLRIDDHPDRLLFVLQDVTERRRAEERLQHNERQLALVVDTAPAFIAHCDRAGRYRFVSRAYADLFGVEPEALVGRTISSLVGGETFERIRPHVATVLTGRPVEFELTFARPRAAPRILHARYAPERDDTGQVRGFVAVVTDLTERRRADEELRRAHQLIEGITQGTDDLIAAVDDAYRFTFFNDAYRRVYEHLWGRPPRIGVSILDDLAPWPNEQRRIEALWRRALDGESYSVTTDFGPGDRERRTFDLRFGPVRDGDGRAMGASHILRDVTEAVRMREALEDREEELRQLNATLERRVADRTADLDARNNELQTFAYVASHDLREPLRKIRTFGEMLADGAADRLDDEERFFLDRMASAASRMDGLLNDLLAFSRVTTHTTPFVPVDVAALVSDVLSDYELRIRETDAAVTVDADVTVEADPRQLRQLLTNLVGNALKYRRADVRPRVKIDAARVGIRPTGPVAEDAPGDVVCRITVADNGIGFEEAFSEKIFEPFQRLHGRGVYEGTGMGLAICRRIVQRHGGSISATSTPGEGSRFVVHLPARQSEA